MKEFKAKRFIALALVAGLMATTATAGGPIRNWIKNRQNRGADVVYSTSTTVAADCVGGVCSPAFVPTMAPAFPAPAATVISPAPVYSVVETAAPVAPVVVAAPAPVRMSAPMAFGDAPFTETATGFRGEFLKAIRKARQSGEINARQAVALRVASFSPACMSYVENLAVTQMAFSEQGADFLPMADDGTIDKTAINWAELADFLERIMPIVLQLLSAFGVLG